MNVLSTKETGSHYTSADLSNFMAEKLLHYFKQQSNNAPSELTILDPSCGDGELLKAVNNIFHNYPSHLIGIDTSKEAIDQLNLNYSKNNIDTFNMDYLELFENEADYDLFSQTESSQVSPLHENGIIKKADLIIANPPYVRTQVMGADKAQQLSLKFNLKGRVDLYQVFLVAMTKQLKEDGIICVITSNRYLTTTGGKDTRKFLDDNYEILEVIDLGDTKLFNAAVLPAIFIGRKKKNNEIKRNKEVNFMKVYEEANHDIDDKVVNAKTLFHALNKNSSGIYNINDKKYKVTVGYLGISEDPAELWVMASKEDKEWADKLRKNSHCKFEDVFKVRVGIKTTADNVFISDKWEKEEFIPEGDLLFLLVSSDSASKWRIDSAKVKKRILYTHFSNHEKKEAIDITKYPNAQKYLNMHRQQLEGRKYVIRAKRNWYEIWVPQDPNALNKPKVIFPDISPSPKFAIDLTGYMVDGNCYWLSLIDDRNSDLLYLATAVANSKIMNKYHEIEFQNVLYSGRKRYLTQYVKNYLLPDPLNINSLEAINLTKKLVENVYDENEVLKLELLIEENILRAFDIKL
ncbi:N-6 DNA methylase [Paenibacillus sp. KS-LC4]|uniref:Eco57I restriction-modification methylase domain-containing protein n=1 Tax=Paenibacillus sp. KS-LC4 TaxID=2979727 RepID=UPI0030CF813C